jgi:hypothetical protein
MKIDSGSTNYEEQLVDYFKLDRTKKWSESLEELEKLITITPVEIKKSKIKINNKIYKIEKDLLDSSFEQFVRLDNLIAENDNVNNLHKLLAIYLRPVKWFQIEKYNLKTQDIIAEELLQMDMNIAQGLLLFFSQYANKYMDNINISYLNRMRKVTK